MLSTQRNWGGLAVALCLFLVSCSGGGGGGLAGGGSAGDNQGGNGSSSGGENPFAGLTYFPGDHVATLEVEATASSEFALHGNVPLPAKTYPSTDGKKSFGVLDYDGTLIPAQVEIASRYPDASDGADIVEIWARVRKDPVLAAGARLQYRVVELFYEPAAPTFEDLDTLINTQMSLSPEVKLLLQSADSIVLRAEDVFGNAYEFKPLADSASSLVLQKGPSTVQWRHFGHLTPTSAVSGAQGTLSRLMSVHSYPRISSVDPFVQLDLRVSNGAIGANPLAPEPLSKMYFSHLELRVPKGFAVIADVADPLFGSPVEIDANTVSYSIVKPNADGTMHLMPRQSLFPRRLAIVRGGSEALAQSRLALEGLGFARAGTNFSTGKALYSWQNPLTARYFPQKLPLPNYDHIGQASILAKDSAELSGWISVLSSGSPEPDAFPVSYGAMGAFHPTEGQYGGMTGGYLIGLVDGAKIAYAASRQGVRSELLHLRMYMEREPIVIYRADGEPASPLDFLKQGSGFQYVPFDFFLNPNGSSGPTFFGMNLPPNFQVAAVEAQGKKPIYESMLSGFSPVDYQHYVRVTGRAKTAIYLANDALAKDDLRLLAHIHWLSFHQFYNNAYQGTQGSGLKSRMNFVKANPNKSLPFGRGEGWGIDAMNVVYGGSSDAWRAGIKPWYDAVVDTVAAGQSCTGAIGADTYIKLLDGLYRTRQTYEESIVQNAMMGVLGSVYRGTSETAKISSLQNIVANSVRSMTGPLGWSTSLKGPWYQLAIGPNDITQPLFCTSIPADGNDGGIDGFQSWCAYAYAYLITGEQDFLNKAIEQGGGSVSSLKTKLQFNGYGENHANQVHLLRLGQDLGQF